MVNTQRSPIARSLFVRRLRFRLVKNINRKMDSCLFRVFPWLIIKIRIIGLMPHAHQLPGALFVRRLRFRLVKNKNSEMNLFLFRGFSVFFRG